jgi:hypothetical protein
MALLAQVSTQTLYTKYLQISSITGGNSINTEQLFSTVTGLGQIYPSTSGGGGITTLPSTISTFSLLTSSLTASTITSQQFVTNANALSLQYPMRDPSTFFLYAASTGYIGIGTSSPSNLLEVKDWTDSNYTGSLLSLQTGQAGIAPTASNFYYYTGTQQTYTVPSNVYRLQVHMWGGGGKAGSNGGNSSAGGGGAYLAGFLDVAPGEQFFYRVAQGGQVTVGGYGGGGNTNAGVGGGTGGGASWFIRVTGSNTLAVVGGGGGGGPFSTTNYGGAASYTGVGFRAGPYPQTQTTTPTTNQGGGGDTNAVSPAPNGATAPLYPGSNGTPGQGGNGNSVSGAAAGGGGGWVGGGGGGLDTLHGGGGGGSSYSGGFYTVTGENATGSNSGGSNALRIASANPSAGTGGVGSNVGFNGLIAIVEYGTVSAKNVKMINLLTNLGATTSYFGADGALGLNTSNITTGYTLDVAGSALLRNAALSTMSVGNITNSLRLGTLSSLTSINYNGLLGNYNNTVLAEISTGAGTQELLMFKGSSASDRVRVQTTGNFVVETGVSARLWSSNTIPTQSNATPAFIINTSSNVGIQTASPGATLDVAGTGRFQTVSSLTANVSTLNGGFPLVNAATTAAMVIVTAFTNQVYFSYDGMRWVSGTGIGNQNHGLAFNGFYWISGTESGIFRSGDGIIWSATTFTSSATSAVAWNGTVWVVGGWYGGMWYSYDGYNWTQSPQGPTGAVQDVAWGGDKFISVGAQQVHYSFDGILWFNLGNILAGSDQTYCVAYNGRIWLIGGRFASVANIAYSFDGITWINTAMNAYSVYDLAWSGSIWVAATGTNQTVLSSLDGITWTARTNTNFTDLGGGYVTWNGSYFFTASGNSAIYLARSPDGINWTSLGTMPTGSNPRKIKARMMLPMNGAKQTYGLYNPNIFLGISTPQTAVRFPGPDLLYRNTVIGESSSFQTRFAQELVLFKGSTIADRIRMQTTGEIRFESGVSSRFFSTFSSIQAVATPAFLISTNSNVGIGTALPAATLDVVGTGRFQTLSTLNINLSTINGQVFGGPINSTVIGLGSAGYISTSQLVSTVAGLVDHLELTSTVAGLGTLGYVSSLSLVSTTGGITSNYSTFFSTTIATYAFPYSGAELYLNYTQTVSPYYQLGINNIIGTNASNVTSVNGNTSNNEIVGFQSDFYLPEFIITGLWTVTLFSQASGTGLAVYASLFQRDPTTTVETLIATSSNSPFIVPQTKVSLDLVLDVPYTTITPGNTLVIKIFANNSGSPSRDLTTFYENGNYSHVATTLGIGAIATNLFQSTVIGLGTLGYVSTSQLVSTTAGLGSAGYISSSQLVSTVIGLGTAGYISTVVAGGSAFPSTISTIYGSSFNTFFLNASTMAQVNIRPTSCNMWVAVGNDATAANKVKYSYNGLNWSNSSGANFSGTAIGVAFNGSLWVVVGSDATNTIKYSGDGITWSNGSGGFTSSGGTGVVWNGRIWVAVGNGTATTSVKYSGDGINWSNGAGGFTTAGYGVAWSGRMFVAVGDDTTAANRTKYSYDGINWSNGSGATFATTGTGVAYNGRMWVATGIDSGNGMVKYSFDGITWSNSSGATFQTNARSVAWNGRMWVAIGNDSTQCMKYSYDGITWSNSLGPNFVSGAGFGVVWNGSVWTVTGQDATQNNTIKYSGDGINWSNSSGVGFTGWGWGIAYSSNTIPSYNQTNYEIESQNIPIYLRSTNQLAFLASTMIFNDTLVVDTTNRVGINTGFPQTDLDVAGVGRFQTLSTLALNLSSINGQGFGFPSTVSTVYGSSFNTLLLTASTISFVNMAQQSTNMWIAVGGDTGTNIKYSYNGITWSNTSGPRFTVEGDGVAYNGTTWVAVGGDSTSTNTIKYSLNGMTWSNSTGSGFATGGCNVAWNGRLWVAVGDDATANGSIKYSLNGISWSNSASGAFLQEGRGIAWNGNMWVAAGIDSLPTSTLKYSYNGINWSSIATGGFANYGASVAWNGRMWVAAGNDAPQYSATLQYSYDGINWSDASSLVFDTYATGVAWNGRMWVATGADPVANKTIQYSYDGINWISSVSGGFTSIGYSVAWNGSVWVAVGNSSPASSRIKYSSDGMNWSNASGTAFTSGVNGIAYSSNTIPSYNQTNFEIEPQNIPVYLRSTNQMSFLQSTIILNNTLYTDMTNRVGINTGFPRADLDVAGIGLFQTLSTATINISSIATLNVSSMNRVNIPVSSSNLWIAVGDDNSNGIRYSFNGSNWSNTLISGAFGATGKGNGIAYNGSVWVAVGVNPAGSNGNVLYSLDGFTWNTVLGAYFFTSGNGVAWNGRQWIAVGSDTTSNGTIKFSSDGITWSNVTSGGFTASGANVAWNGRFWVAVGQDATVNNTIKYSFNGRTWSNASSGGFDGNGGSNVAWNGKMWIAVGDDNVYGIRYSFDGSNWSNTNNGFTLPATGIAWNGSMWVAVGGDATQNNRIKYSYDGLNWSNSSGVGFTSQGNAVAWNGSYWLALGDDSATNSTIKYSFNGITWSNSVVAGFATGVSGAGAGVAFSSNQIPSYNQGNFEIEPQNIPIFLRSTNQMSFLQSSIILNNTLTIDATEKVGISLGAPQYELDVGGTARVQTLSTQTINLTQASSNIWVAVGSDTTTANRTKYSLNGSSWSNATGGGFTTQGNGVAWNGSLWVSVGQDSTSANTIKYSYNGVNWSNSSSGAFTGTGNCVAWSAGLWVAVGTGTATTSMKFSFDGINWLNGTGGFGTNGRGVAANGRLWVAVGNDSSTPVNTIKYSFNGRTWISVSSGGFLNTGNGIGWNGRVWVAVGDNGATAGSIQYSYDSINWSNANNGFTSQGWGVAWNGSIWVAVGADSTAVNTIKYSYDGVNWSNSAGTGFTSAGYAISWNGSRWVALGNGTATTSTKSSADGITWTNGSGAFTLAGFGVAYSYNNLPTYNQTNFEIQPQNIPIFTRSTNQMSFTLSSIILNNTLTVDATNKVGVNLGFPQADLDVGGTGRFQILSTQTIFASSIITPYIYIPQFITF